jgi:hypothetical protein
LGTEFEAFRFLLCDELEEWGVGLGYGKWRAKEDIDVAIVLGSGVDRSGESEA